MSLVEVKVPDIGDFKDVDVIEVNIKPGDVIENEQALMTLESDKASIEVPSDTAGTVKEVRVKAGDKVSQGTIIALVESSADAAPAKDAPKAPAKEPEKAPATQAEAKPQAAAAAPKAAAPAPQAGSFSGNADIECEMLVLGSGPGGYSAAFRSADLGMKTVLVERYATLGGVCLNVGCIPSKALLHTALVIDEADALGAHGITFGKPQIDLDKLRDFKSGVVKKLTSGLAGMAKARK
ncbi:MAG: biotin/lipoyl-containing protein, partial [Paraburkholderia sp.]